MRTVDDITSGRRMRRNRRFEWIRRLTRETVLTVDDLIWPIFIVEGTGISKPIPLLPGVECHSIDRAAKIAEQAFKLGLPAITIFPRIPMEKRDETGSTALDENGLVSQAVRTIKQSIPDIGVITDVALDSYTSHGHDGILRDGIILNDETVEQIAKVAIVQANAGADIISCSEMMDGRVGAIRDSLDTASYHNVGILSYAAKYASAFYAPYRNVVGADKVLRGDKHSYFMDMANSNESLQEAKLDIREGADMLMVKPAMPYLDIIHRLKEKFAMPIFAYQVSGEYAMIMAAAQNGMLNEKQAMIESLTGIKRAGADAILTYFAPKAARALGKKAH